MVDCAGAQAGAPRRSSLRLSRIALVLQLSWPFETAQRGCSVVPGPGFEPGLRGSEPRVLPLDQPGKRVPPEGIEPTTNRLKAGCSTVELRRHAHSRSAFSLSPAVGHVAVLLIVWFRGQQKSHRGFPGWLHTRRVARGSRVWSHAGGQRRIAGAMEARARTDQ